MYALVAAVVLLGAPAVVLDLEQDNPLQRAPLQEPYSPWQVEEPATELEDEQPERLQTEQGSFELGAPVIREQLFEPAEVVPTYEPLPGETGGSGLAEPLFPTKEEGQW